MSETATMPATATETRGSAWYDEVVAEGDGWIEVKVLMASGEPVIYRLFIASDQDAKV